MPAPTPQQSPVLAVIEQTPVILQKILLAATDQQMAWKPSADRWSIGEVLGHLSDVEMNYRRRIRKMAEEESPVLENYDQDAAYSAGKYSGRPGREQLDRFCRERGETLSWLRHLPADLAERAGQHSTLGRITVGELMQEWAFHDLGHIRQVAELYRTCAFYPHIGAYQRIYSPKP
jgi:DinB family protein